MKAPAIKLTGIAMGMLLSASALAVNPGNPDPGTPPGTGFPAVSDFAASGPFSVTNSNVNTACRSEEHTSELQSRPHLVCRLLLEKKKKKKNIYTPKQHINLALTTHQ